MPGKRIKRDEAEAMFADYLAGMTWEGMARKFGRSDDRIRALARRENWNKKVADAHEERLLRMAREFVKEDEHNIKTVIAARNMLADEMRDDWEKKRGSRVPESKRIEMLLKAVGTLDALLGTLTGRDKGAPAVAVNIGVSVPPLFTPAQVASLAAEHERLRIETAKTVEVEVKDGPAHEVQGGSGQGGEAHPALQSGMGGAAASGPGGEPNGAGAGGGEAGAAAEEAATRVVRAPWECPFVFASPECGYRGIVSSCDGRLETCKAIGNSTRYGGRPMTPEERAANQKPGKNGGME